MKIITYIIIMIAAGVLIYSKEWFVLKVLTVVVVALILGGKNAEGRFINHN